MRIIDLGSESMSIKVGDEIIDTNETCYPQYLISRHNIGGGINYFYGNGREPTEVPQIDWTQKSYFDSYYFDRSLWHSVSPIVSGAQNGGGHRDVLLLDFVKPS